MLLDSFQTKVFSMFAICTEIFFFDYLATSSPKVDVNIGEFEAILFGLDFIKYPDRLLGV